MNQPDFHKFICELEHQLERRYHDCEDFAATPSSILLAVLNAVAAARISAEAGNDSPAGNRITEQDAR